MAISMNVKWRVVRSQPNRKRVIGFISGRKRLNSTRPLILGIVLSFPFLFKVQVAVVQFSFAILSIGILDFVQKNYLKMFKILIEN